VTAVISVVVGEPIPLMREGICKIIAGAPDLELAGDTGNRDHFLQLVANREPKVVLADLRCPTPAKCGLIKRLKRMAPTTRIVVLGDGASESCVMACVEAGAAGYIIEDASADQLLQTIRGVYAGEAVVDLSAMLKAAKKSHIQISGSINLKGINLRELGALQLAARGLSNKAIAQKMFVSERTIHSYFRSMFRKMGVASRTEAIYQALANDWFTLD